MQKGQTSPLLLWAMGIASSAFLGYGAWTATAVNSTRGEIGKVIEQRTQDVQRITVVETDATILKSDVKEIKADIKEILRLLK